MVSAKRFTKAQHKNQMSLLELLDRYSAAVSISPRYGESLRRTVRKLESSGVKNVCQLSPEAVNRVLVSLPLSRTTIHNIRRETLTLWRFAYESGMTEVPPLRVRRVACDYKPVMAWSMEDLARLSDEAEQDETPVSTRVRLRRCDIMPAWCGIGYDSGARFSDVHALRCNQIRNGCVMLVAHKTGKPLVRKLSARTLKHVERLAELSPDGTLFKWALPRRRAFKLWRAFLDEHRFTGSSKWLRRSAATMLHNRQRGSATDFLQHSDPKLAFRHYIDVSLSDVPAPPPPIGRASGR